MNEELRTAIIAYLDALDVTPNWESGDVSSKVSHISKQEVANPIGYVDVSEGASKICLVFKKFPFVIKWNTYNYGEAVQEVEIYKAAVACGLGYFFPKTELFYERNGVSFVLQEKVDCSAGDARHKEDYVKVIKRITKTPTSKIYDKMQADFNKAGNCYRRTLDEDWAKMVISLYGKKVAKALCKFIIAHKINDLHSSNIGYKDFRPILLDFSGYHR